MFLLFLFALNELEVISRAQARAGSKLVSDATLTQAAECLAKFGRTGRQLSTPFIRYCTDITGVYEGSLLPILFNASEGQDVTETLELFFKNEAAPRRLTHYGAASIRGDGTKTLALIASQRLGALVIESQSRERVEFRANVLPGHTKMRAVMTDPSGRTDSIPLSGGKGVVELKAKGRYQLEILADGKDGPHVIANRAVFAGVDAPKQPPPANLVSREPPVQRMLALMNAARAQMKAPPLTLNADVTKVAQAHARDMRDKRYFAHNSPSGETLADRLKKAGVPYVLSAENLSTAATAEDAHESLMGSPGHRKNIIEAALKEVGIGVVPMPITGGDTLNIFVVDFVTTPKEQSLREIQDAVLTTINQIRAQAGRPPMKADKALSAVAERHSQAMAAEDELRYIPSQEKFFAEAARVAPGDAYDADIYATTDPSAVRKSSNPDKPVNRLGIGVAASTSKGTGMFWVTVIYGR